MRAGDRKFDQIRPVTIHPNYIPYPEGSVLFEMGNTKVICNVTIEESIPRWMYNQRKTGGWVTAEYAMLPRATRERTQRETRGLGGRTQEIRRLIGRSLRAAVDLQKLGERTCIVDCDVIQADGGTRTASITGGYIALAMALNKLKRAGVIKSSPIQDAVAAISIGILNGQPLLDLNYDEDSQADVDVNIVMTGSGKFIEVQGTAEKAAFSRDELDRMLDLASQGIQELLIAQQQALEEILE